MHILLVSHVPNQPFAGSSKVYHLLQNGFESRGHTVTTLHFEDFRIPRAAQPFVSRLLLPQVASRRTSQEKLENYDVVMSSSGMLFPLFRKLRSVRKRPLRVAHLHGSSFFDNQAHLTEARRGHGSVGLPARFVTGPLREHWDVAGSLHADCTVVQNGCDKDYLAERGIQSIELIPLPVDPDIAAAGASSTIDDRDPNHLLWFGSWEERKGSAYVPRALRIIAARHPDVRLSIVGAASSAARIQAEFGSDLMQRVTVVPRMKSEEMIAALRKQSIVLFPSICEGYGFALLEAMAMGMASVTTFTGLGADVLRDRENAMMIPMGSSLHLAQATLCLMENEQLRHHIAMRARAYAQTVTLTECITRYERFFLKERHKSQLDVKVTQPGIMSR